MKYLTELFVAILLLSSCIRQDEEQINDQYALKNGFCQVHATNQTDPVESSDDAADDPAIWVNPTDFSKSTIIATDKQRGLLVYDLSGKELFQYDVGRVNNVDVRSGFIFGEDTIAIVAATNRTFNSISYFKVEPETGELSILSLDRYLSKSEEIYGFALAYPIHSNQLYAISVTKGGHLEQWAISESDGELIAERVRSIMFNSKCEGIVADDELGNLFVGEEGFGVWKLDINPDTGDKKELIVDLTNENLEPDIEGLAIYYAPDKKGYLIASSQGNNSYAVFQRAGDHDYLGSFMIVKGEIDGTSDTDGIEVLNMNLGPEFPNGVFIAQDGYNYKKDEIINQCFKLVDWKEIAMAFEPALIVDPEYVPAEFFTRK